MTWGIALSIAALAVVASDVGLLPQSFDDYDQPWRRVAPALALVAVLVAVDSADGCWLLAHFLLGDCARACIPTTDLVGAKRALGRACDLASGHDACRTLADFDAEHADH